MLSRQASLIPLMIAAGILLAGNGIQTTLLTVRASAEGFRPTEIGFMGTAYFAGFVIGTFTATRLIEAVGHIRVFAALASVVAAGAMLLVLYIEPYSWMAIRAVMGFCFSGLFTAIESWLGAISSSENRGRVFSIYSLVDVAAVTGSQFLLPALGVGGFVAFAVMSMLIGLSLVPIALAPTAPPEHQAIGQFNPIEALKVSPLAFITCFTVGLTSSALKTMGPLYASGIGLGITELAFFMGAAILGGAVLQLPFGWASDHFDRRKVTMVATAGAGIAGLVLSMLTGAEPNYVYAGVFLFGAFANPLYSLAAAHANDFAKAGQIAQVSAGLLLTYAVGAMIGPLLASVIIQTLGPPAFFAYTGLVHLSLLVFGIVRTLARPTVPKSERVKHVPAIKTNPSLFGGEQQVAAKAPAAPLATASPAGSHDTAGPEPQTSVDSDATSGPRTG